MATVIDLPIDRARFPQRCVSCGAAPDTTIGVECTSGVDLVLVKFWRWHDFTLPACSSCRSRRKRAGIVFTVLSIVAVPGLLLGMFALERVFVRWGQRDLWLGLTLVSFLAAVYFVRNWVPPLLDARLLGVRGVRLTKGGVGTLRFRDDGFAGETAACTAEASTTEA